MPHAFFDFLDLDEYGITEQGLRGGYHTRLTLHPWSVQEDIKLRLRLLLEAHGFEVEKNIQAQEFAKRDGFLFTQ